jgi:hypothetical protein
MPHDAAVPAERDEIFAAGVALSEQLSSASDNAAVGSAVRGGRERGLVVHKLLEEVLTGETAELAAALEIRPRALLAQLDVTEAARPEDGPHAPEIVATVRRAFAIPEIAACGAGLFPK